MLSPVRDGDEPAELSESFLRPASGAETEVAAAATAAAAAAEAEGTSPPAPVKKPCGRPPKGKRCGPTGYEPTGYRGVRRASGYAKFIVQIYYDNRSEYLGGFPTAEAAALAYNQRAKELGKPLNVIKSTPSGYRGVRKIPNGKFEARIWYNKGTQSLGTSFPTAEAAALAYNQRAKKLGKPLNVIKTGSTGAGSAAASGSPSAAASEAGSAGPSDTSACDTERRSSVSSSSSTDSSDTDIVSEGDDSGAPLEERRSLSGPLSPLGFLSPLNPLSPLSPLMDSGSEGTSKEEDASVDEEDGAAQPGGGTAEPEGGQVRALERELKRAREEISELKQDDKDDKVYYLEAMRAELKAVVLDGMHYALEQGCPKRMKSHEHTPFYYIHGSASMLNDVRAMVRAHMGL